MPNARLLQIAEALGKLYQLRKDDQIQLAHLDDDRKGRELALTPADGWPGKNEGARAFARAAVLTTDATLTAIRADETRLRSRLADTEAEIEALEAERRAIEWGIRETLALALTGRRNGHGEPADIADVDDAADEAATDEMPF